MDVYPPLATDEFIVCAFVGILEAAPPTYVVDEDSLVVGAALLDIVDEALERIPSCDAEAAASFVGLGPDDLEISPRGVGFDDFGLVLGRIALMICRHAHVLRCPCLTLFFFRFHHAWHRV